MFNIAICDDDAYYTKKIFSILDKYTADLSTNIKVFDNGDDFKESLNIEYDLVFMDYYLENIDGFSILQELRKTNKRAILVFFTSNENPEPDFFNVNIYRYLLKSYSDEKIDKSIRDIVEYMKEREIAEIVEIKVKGDVLLIDARNIVYVQKSKYGSDVIYYDVEKGFYTQVRSMEHIDSIYEKVNEIYFAYPHCSYFVNIRKIKSKSGNLISMENGTNLSISRSSKNSFTDNYIRCSKVLLSRDL